MKLVSIAGSAVVGLLTVAGIGGVVLGQSGNKTLQQSPRQICTRCGGDGDPSSVSEDGRFLLFNGRRDYGDLSIRNIATGKVKQLLAEPAFSPVLSPDGKQVIYLGATNSNVSFTSGDPSGSYDLRIVANQVGAKPRILNDDPEFHSIVPAAWAPDGESILAVLNIKAKGYAIGWVSASDGKVRVLKSLAGRFNCCHRGLPSLSPDGKSIAYAASPLTNPNDGFHIYVLPADNSVPEKELVKGGTNWSPVWMPDGKNLLFVSDREGSGGLWSAAVNGGPLKPIRSDMGDILSVRVSNSGSYFYTREVSNSGFAFRAFTIWSRSAPSAVAFRGELARWSADGTSFAYLGSERNRRTYATLHVYSRNTKEERRYVPGGTLKVSWVAPQWLHHGKSVVVWVEESGGMQSPYRVDLETGAFKRIAEISTDDTNPVAISSDDKTAYLVLPKEGRCSSDQIVAVDLDSGVTRQVASVPLSSDIFLSADDRTLYMIACDDAGTSSRRLVSVDVATGKQRDLFVVKSPQSLKGLAVSPNNQTLATIIEESPAKAGDGPIPLRNQRLVRIEVDGTGYKELLMLMIPTGTIENVNWSRDGAEVFFEQSLFQERALLRMSANGGAPRSFAPANVMSGSLSPDESQVMVVRDSWTEQQLWVLDDVPSLLRSARAVR